MCRREHDRGGVASPSGLEPAQGTEAPAISRHETRKAPLRSGGDKIVARRHGEGQKIGRHHRAHGVGSRIGIDRAAAAVAEEAGQRGMGASDQRTAENVAVGHALGGGRGAVEGDHR